MIICEGKSVYGGIAIGKIKVYKNNSEQVIFSRIEDAEKEIRRFYDARDGAIDILEELYEKACNEVGKTNAAIFEIHQMMLRDDDFLESVENIIRSQSVNAEYAVYTTGENFSQMFAAMNDEYMKARAADVKDISKRVVDVLKGRSEDDDLLNPVIVFAEDLAPSETIRFNKDKVLAFVTEKGSVNSHTAILARTMSIPAIINCDISELMSCDGKIAIVDGFEGRVYIDPTAEVLYEKQNALNVEIENKRLLEQLKNKDTVTVDGKRILLYANIEDIKGLALAIQNDAGGVGLFRSEFIYLERNDFPTEEEQFAIYKQVAENMAGKKVIIRTLDIGADKQAEYFNLPYEENPAMGMRAIRICLSRPEIFKTQLRALFRGAAFGNISVMYPMISSLKEVRKIKEIVSEVVFELGAEGVSYRIPEQGIMIETPAAVMLADELAAEVDFFSIGTNDLSQYTMAIDRQNPSLGEFFDAHSEAVMRMIEKTVESGHQNGIWVGICGELGGDAELTERFLKMGVDELSVSPGLILPIRKRIREINLKE